MKLSLPNVFCIRPGVRIHDGRNGVSASQCAVARILGNVYGIPSEAWMLPGCEGSVGSPASSAGSSATAMSFGRSGMNTCECQPTTLPWPSSAAL